MYVLQLLLSLGVIALACIVWVQREKGWQQVPVVIPTAAISCIVAIYSMFHCNTPLPQDLERIMRRSLLLMWPACVIAVYGLRLWGHRLGLGE